MGLKEEYVFDENDFDKYLEYCKNSENYYPRFPTKRNPYLTIVSIYFLKFSFYMGFIPELIWTISFLFYINFGPINNDVVSTYIVCMSVFLLIQLSEIKTIHRINISNQKEVSEVNSEYEKEYFYWVSKVKEEYLKTKQKEFKNYKKYLKREKKQDLVNDYWIPSWVYFIIRIKDNVVRYIGQTMNEYSRQSDHHNKIYPKNEFYFELIEKVDINKIDEKEKFWINLFGLKNLDNHLPGGSGVKNRKNFKRKPIPYENPKKQELEKVKKWIKISQNIKKN